MFNKIAKIAVMTCLCAFTLVATEYKWDNSPKDSAALKEKVTAASKEFNWAIRKIASSRLTKATAPYQTIELTIDGDRVAFSRNGKDRVETTFGATPAKWFEDTKVTFEKLADGQVKQNFLAEDGRREFLYKFEEDGSLAVTISLFSEKLKAPIVYQLKYLPVKK